ncbi:rhodanese-like domain-containing protein [Paraburkholderia sp. EG285A]|uniref:rhodanese-like domain-containing protein n=1 Tax=Paraburkholderia sp. EG285A TaxID=3237009 RepID=UPI0034D37F47
MSHDTPYARIQPRELHARLAQPNEIAVLDVREQGEFFDRHLLFSSVAPLGRLGLVIDRLVPRRATPVVLVDNAGEYTSDAATWLARFGYTNIAILDGGVSAWQAAGLEVFSGTNVVSKAFGEIIEHQLDTPNIDAVTLKALQDRGADLVVLDSRPFDEFRRMSIPGGIDCPGAELVYRVGEVAPSPHTLVVVNCAGRTRSILGAQSLVNAGIPNPVAALTGGSMAWLLEGFELEHWQVRHAPRPASAQLADARARAERVALQSNVRVIDAATLARFEAERDTRTLYRFDVRDPHEYAAGHAPGWRNAPGGQLVQATDEYIGTRGARVVLTDEDCVQARITASWLTQLGGYEIYLYDDALDAAVETGAEPLIVLRDARVSIDWAQPSEVADAGLPVIDVENSLRFRDAHIEGAFFVAASAVGRHLRTLEEGATVVLTSSDGVLASLVAQQVAQAASERGVRVRAVLGGTARWKSLGLPLASGDAGNLTGQVDRRYGAYDVPEHEAAERMREYLQWELDLAGQLERSGGAGFDVRDFGHDTTRRSHAALTRLVSSLPASV